MKKIMMLCLLVGLAIALGRCAGDNISKGKPDTQQIIPAKKIISVKDKENTILAGLLWLARHQNPDGSWGAKTFQNQCQDAKCSGTGDEQFNIGLTGLAMLAFTQAGYTNTSRDTYDDINFGDVVRKAVLYLMAIQISDGSFGGVKQGKFIYNQAIATLALTDLYILTIDRPTGVLFKEPAERAVKFLLEAQNPNSGWRYQPRDGQNDTSVIGWVMLALKSSEKANIPVPSEAFAGIKSFLDGVTDPNYGRVGYTTMGTMALMAHEDPRNVIIQPTLTAIGVMARNLIDKNPDDPLIKLGIQQLNASIPVWDMTRPGIIDFDYWFFGAYCFEPTEPWIAGAENVLCENQRLKGDGCCSGSWDPIDRWSGEGGRIYSTAINTLTLLRCYQ